MATETIFYILLAGAISMVLAFFMYGYRSKQAGNLRWVFGALRFVVLFSVLLLIINPEFRGETYSIEKPKLPILVDNSASVEVLEQEKNVTDFIKKLKENKKLNAKFDLSYFSFGSTFRGTDSLSYTEKNTNISQALSSANQIFKNHTAPTILITDGNQTLGTDYEFSSTSFKNPVYPVILGDSIQYTDLKIQQLNTNRYAFLKNQFPVEVILTFSGVEAVNSEFIVTQGESTIYRKKISLSEKENSTTLNFHLPANSVGLQKYTAQILPLDNEKNKTNNIKHFAVEVIDQATNVLVVSQISHPDLGVLKRSITTNEQRTLTLKKPVEAASVLNDYQLIILYQPDRNFAAVFSEIDKLGKNSWIIAGLDTDWTFLNSAQENFKKNSSSQKEAIQALYNSNYATFAVDDLGFDDFPPLYTRFGQLTITVPYQMLLEQTVNRIATENPLLATMEINGKRNALWDGEGFWRWRAQSYLKNDSFQNFDDFVGGIVQYLASNKRRSRLEVSSETFYYNNNPIKVSAQYFDANYNFDNRASLTITLTNQETEKKSVYPMLLRNNFFEVDLNSLPAGEYRYTVSVSDENFSSSGSFTILDFDVEQQFLNADIYKLRRTAENTGGKEYFVTDANDLIDHLINDSSYQSIQKAEIKTIPLIDWKYLLALIVIALSAEWFLRKYNGLI